MRARGIMFGVAIAFSVWNLYTNGINVRTVAVCAMVLVCLAMNIYNYHQKMAARQAEEQKIREKEEVRKLRADARRKASRKSRRHTK